MVKRRHDKYYVYMLRCANGHLYTGYTNNVEKRVKRHNDGHGAKSLRGKLPVTLAYTREYRYFKHALRGEQEIKKLTKKQKEELVESYGQ